MTATLTVLPTLTARLVLATVAAIGLLLVPATAFAQSTPYAPAGSPSVSSTSPAPGAPLSVAGAGFAAGSTVRVVIFSTPVVLGTATVDAAGEADVDVTVPASFRAGSEHRIELQGVDPSGEVRILTQDIRLAGGTSDDALAKTGAVVVPVVLAGVVLLGAGGALVLSGRRRAQAG